MKIHDISRPIHSGMLAWPGDTPAELTFPNTKAQGYSANVGRLRLSLHCGTHADAPYHYNDAGLKMDAVPMETYVGAARVVDIRGHDAITTSLLAAHDFSATPRVLFKSDTWTDPHVFPSEWPLLAPDVPAWLAARGVKLIGLDVPSVDHIKSKELPIHHACDAAGILIIENLDLRAITPGIYELIALPLRIQGADGSPIRAVLRER